MYLDKFKQSIEDLKKEYRYREFNEVARIAGNYPYAKHFKTEKEIVMWCSNDYLAMGQNKILIENYAEKCREYGVGAGGTRNISGNSNPLVVLEKDVAKLHKKNGGLVFSSGYIANQATISTIAKILPNLVIFSDSCNHASIIEGIKLSKGEKHVFAHNDPADLEKKLKLYTKDREKLIIFESIYSMTGNIAPIAKFVELAKKYQALTFVDEVHAIGLYGKGGGGLVEKKNLTDEIDILQGTFAKAYGLIGGYVATNDIIIDAIRSYAPGFIFTTALPPALASTISKSIELVSKADDSRKKLFANVALLKEKLKKANIEQYENNGHIIPIMVRDAKKCKYVSDELIAKHQIYIQAINYPTVPKGTERLRITVNPFHTNEMMDDLVDKLKLYL